MPNKYNGVYGKILVRMATLDSHFLLIVIVKVNRLKFFLTTLVQDPAGIGTVWLTQKIH